MFTKWLEIQLFFDVALDKIAVLVYNIQRKVI